MMKTYDRSTYKGKKMMWRLDILYTLFLGSLLVLVPGVHAGNATVRSPNVLFISVDDLNDWVNCLGGREGVHTPHIDRLAKRGRLEAQQIDKFWLTTPTAVEKFIHSRKETGFYRDDIHLDE